ncbi:MAG: sigma factor-like helix-turn-helix DNA-binding protein [Coprobacter fastidiosus]
MQILKPEERAIIQLFYLEDLSLNKVSEVMNMPSGTSQISSLSGSSEIECIFR